ncbi:unnamed protein product [Allacma fusca]|uniref:Uncharacterized protein n=1 Tax=Allacma fusca TaxID=39272 RepID=A0A8J2KP65_9HEXA|nr:unnamed protein product [Allacma fusca]
MPIFAGVVLVSLAFAFSLIDSDITKLPKPTFFCKIEYCLAKNLITERFYNKQDVLGSRHKLVLKKGDNSTYDTLQYVSITKPLKMVAKIPGVKNM